MAPRGGRQVKSKLCAHTQRSGSPCTVPRPLPCSLSSVWDFSPSQPVPYLCLGQGWLQRCEQWAACVCWAHKSGECFPCQKVSRHPPAPQGTGAGYYLGRTVPGKTYISDALDNLRAGHVLLPLLSKAPRKGLYEAPHIPSPQYLQHKEEVDPKTSSLQLGYPVITDRD